MGKIAAIRSSASMRCIGGRHAPAPAVTRGDEGPRQVPTPARTRTSASAARPGRECRGPSPARGSRARPRAGRSAGDRARARRRRRSRPPAARSRTSGKSACEEPARGRGSTCAPRGEWTTSCMPPVSSKNRSTTNRSVVGKTPSSARAGGEVGDDLLGDRRVDPGELFDATPTAASDPSAGSRALRHKGRPRQQRSSETALESSAVRAGASPSQNGTVGEAPSASTTRTVPGSILRMRQVALPRRKTSPAIDSIAQSSLTVPTRVSSGSSTTRKSATSGMAPPEVTAVRRAPRRGLSTAVHAVAVKMRPAPAPAGDDAVGDEADDRLEVLRRSSSL